jgi:hypothetical protein
MYPHQTEQIAIQHATQIRTTTTATTTTATTKHTRRPRHTHRHQATKHRTATSILHRQLTPPSPRQRLDQAKETLHVPVPDRPDRNPSG